MFETGSDLGFETEFGFEKVYLFEIKSPSDLQKKLEIEIGSDLGSVFDCSIGSGSV